MKVSRIAKVAGASLAGFVTVALVADKVNAGQAASQVAGFVGAFLGSLAAGRQSRGSESANSSNPPESTPETLKDSDTAWIRHRAVGPETVAFLWLSGCRVGKRFAGDYHPAPAPRRHHRNSAR